MQPEQDSGFAFLSAHPNTFNLNCINNFVQMSKKVETCEAIYFESQVMQNRRTHSDLSINMCETGARPLGKKRLKKSLSNSVHSR